MVETPQIFFTYAREDTEAVEKVYRRLHDEGLKPWMDRKDILAGESWDSAIKRAIRRSDFVLIFLSKNSVNKRGFIQKEIRSGLEIWSEMLSDDIRGFNL